jgi:hypothetical protein
MRPGRLIAPLVVLCALAGIGSATKTRPYVSGSYLVTVGGKAAGFVSGVSGGGATAGAIADRSSARGAYPNKRPGQVTYEDIGFAVGAGLQRPLSDWIQETLSKGQPVHRDGEVIAVDYAGKERSRTAWTSGYISEVTFPALDAASKDAAEIQLSITPASTKLSRTGSGKVEPLAEKTKAAAAKTVASNFLLKIDGVDPRRVLRVEPISVELKASPAPGRGLVREQAPAQATVSNLVFLVSASEAEPIYKWHEDFVVKGNNGDDREKGGTIELLSADTTKTILQLTLKGIGILKVGPDESSKEVQRLRVEAYVESLELKVP